MKPVYEMAVMNVQRVFPKAQDARVSSGDARFRKTLYDVLYREHSHSAAQSGDGDIKEEFDDAWEHDYCPQFIPDLWWIDEKSRTIHLLEIEDTHALTQKKLMLLHDFWWIMDSERWLVRLTVFDRYGLNPRDLDLTRYAYKMLPVLIREEQAREKKAGEPGATGNPDGAQRVRKDY